MFTESITRLRQSLALFLFTLIYRLLFSRWTGDYDEQHSAWEGSYSGRLGPFHLDLNDCFVLDHRDATISLCLPCPCREQTAGRWGRWRWGQVRLSYAVALGQEQIRPSGWSCYLSWSPVHLVYGRLDDSSHLPF